ncbi:hypothetical protein EIP86_010135 [Pleurotus ostreatoroseus]|nr:hypothetical protein EIP86_010135 [Pleurotus ostreatoroseus]
MAFLPHPNAPCTDKTAALIDELSEKHSEIVNDASMIMFPERMGYRNIPTVVETTIRSLKETHDPLDHYLCQAPDKSDPLWKQIKGRTFYYTAWTKWVNDQSAWTINRGEAYLILVPPPCERNPPGSIDKLLLALLGYMVTSGSEEHTKRLEEFTRKLQNARTKALGDRVKQVYSIAGLGTAPSRAISDYARALVQMVNDKVDLNSCLFVNSGSRSQTSQADIAARAVMVINGNVDANTTFYNSLGYVAVERFYLGEINPAWDEPPVPIDLMLREPKTFVTTDKNAALGL